MTKTNIVEALDIAGLSEVAYPRLDLAPHMDMWDITLPDEQATIRLCDDDGTIYLYVFVNGRAQIEDGRMEFRHAIEDGRMEFRHAMAAPCYVAMMLEQLVADYS